MDGEGKYCELYIGSQGGQLTEQEYYVVETN